MSVEDRLRHGLERNAISFVPEGERRLTAVRARQRRRRGLQASAVAAVATVTAFLGLGVLTGGDPDVRPASPAENRTASSTAPVLTGEYTRRLRDAGDRTGRWVLGFGAEGTLDVTAPPGYRGVVSGALFTTDQGLRTNLFDQDLCSGRGLGTYTWGRSGTVLELVVVDDTCAARVGLLSGGSWKQVDPRGQP